MSKKYTIRQDRFNLWQLVADDTNRVLAISPDRDDIQALYLAKMQNQANIREHGWSADRDWSPE